MTKLSFAQRFSAEIVNSKFGKYKVTYSTPTKEFSSFTNNTIVFDEIQRRFELSAQRLRGVRTAIYYGV